MHQQVLLRYEQQQVIVHIAQVHLLLEHHFHLHMIGHHHKMITYGDITDEYELMNKESDLV